MGLFISLIFSILLLTGCVNKSEIVPVKNAHKSKIEGFSSYNNMQTNQDKIAPKLILPPVYKTISPFSNKTITLNTNSANLYQVLYTISKIAGLNLIIDQDVEKNIPITISVKNANLKNVLDIVMNISGCYYVVEGNILHIKEYMRKKFIIPYVHTNSSFATDLGGDMLSTVTSSGSGGSGGSSGSNGIKGKYSLKYSSPKAMDDFYKHLEDNIKELLSPNGHYTFNYFTGVLSVYDKKRNVDAITNFLKDIKNQYSGQILIEAKILEVSLNRSHQLGIDWNSIGKSIFSKGDRLTMTQNLSLNGAVAGVVHYTSNNFNALINALDENGKIDTVSNPRIKVLNGQTAIISSGKLIPYWEKEVDTSQGTSTNNIQVTYNRRDVLDGVTLGVTPVIMENGKIMLNIVPISSTIEGEKVYYDDTGASVATAPIINIKEAGTVIYAKDNDLVMIGGLISSEDTKTKDNIPVLSDIPLFGNLFTRVNDKKTKKELVILLRLKIIR